MAYVGNDVDILSQYVDPQDYTQAKCAFGDGTSCTNPLEPATRTGLELHNGRIAFLADKGKAGGFDLSKKSTFTFKNVDFSKVQAGNVGTFYLTTLPSGNATGVAPRDLHGSLGTYCDAQGSADWEGRIDRDTAAKQGGDVAALFQACPEFDLFEGNMWGFNTTSHACKMKGDDVTEPVGKACNSGGVAASINAIGDPKTRSPFTYVYNGKSAPGKFVGAKVCDNGKFIGAEALYGPDESCPINTLKPFDVTVTLVGTSGTYKTTLSQGDDAITGGGTDSLLAEMNTKLPWTMIAAQWAGVPDTYWLDAGGGSAGPTPPPGGGGLDCEDPASTNCYHDVCDTAQPPNCDCTKSDSCKHTGGSACGFQFCTNKPPSPSLDCEDPASTNCYHDVCDTAQPGQPPNCDCTKSDSCKHTNGSACGFQFCTNKPPVLGVGENTFVVETAHFTSTAVL